MHPYMTAELVRQLRAGLEAESRNWGHHRPISFGSPWHLDRRPCDQHRLPRLARPPALDRHRSAAVLGVIHLDALPPVGVIRFRQPQACWSGSPGLAW